MELVLKRQRDSSYTTGDLELRTTTALRRDGGDARVLIKCAEYTIGGLRESGGVQASGRRALEEINGDSVVVRETNAVTRVWRPTVTWCASDDTLVPRVGRATGYSDLPHLQYA